MKNFELICFILKNLSKFKHIYETMRVGDLKKTSNLIKEYFPSNYDYTELNGHSQTKVNTLYK